MKDPARAGSRRMPPRRRSQPRSPEHAALGAAIRRLREQAGLSQEGLAEAADIHVTQIGGLERGVSNPNYSTLIKLAAGLETGVGELTALAGRLEEQQRS